MRAHLWQYFLAILMVAVLVGHPQSLGATEKLAPGAAETQKESGREPDSLSRYGQNLLTGLAASIHIPKATAQSFTELFARHGPELERLANAHQNLVWEVLDVVIEVLPSLRKMDENGGQLHVDRKTYAKASDLLGRWESLASPELARALRKAKTLVDSRVKEADPENIIIDLKD
jgi:hypothetical protein